MVDNRTAHDFIQLLTFKAEPPGDAVQDRREHVQVTVIGVNRVGAAERNPAAADNGYLSK
jgi:hypothetical protein